MEKKEVPLFKMNVNEKKPQLNSFSPRRWGSGYWQAMFLRAARFKPTQQEKREVKSIFLSLEKELPCSICRASYKELTIRYPIDDYLSSRKKLLTWLYIIRDQVNRKLIIQERRERDKILNELPIGYPRREEIANEKIYTKPSPRLECILSKWYKNDYR